MTNSHIQEVITFLQQKEISEVVVLTDTNVNVFYPTYLDELNSYFHCCKWVIPAGEAHKTLDQATFLWKELLSHHYDKKVAILNFGGGMVSDIGGFIAATYKRGVAYINYPTTLLAMIDAAHGGKTAVNCNHIKNCIGVIQQPDYVSSPDMALLETLPKEELLSGFGEMIKYALISSGELFEELLKVQTLTACSIKPAWIDHCVRFKQKIVNIDPLDQKERQVLNVGHTFGHALESLYASEGKPIPHGVAVAIGIVFESQQAVKDGFLSEQEYQKIYQLIHKFYNIPKFTQSQCATIQQFLLQDKKNKNGKISYIPLRTIGTCPIL